MIHIYECNDGATTYFEVYQSIIGEPWQDEFLFDFTEKEMFDSYLDNLYSDGIDFVIHNNEEGYDEYHIALPSVQAS